MMKSICKYTVAAALAGLWLATAGLATAAAQSLATQHVALKNTEACGVPVSKASMERNGSLMSVGMNLDLGSFEMHGDQAAIFTPVLLNGGDSLALDPIGLYGRLRYIQYLRSGSRALGGETERSYRYADRPAAVRYSQTVPYEEWMNGATLYIYRSDYGCCHTLLAEERTPLAGWQEIAYTPEFHYVEPARSAAPAVKVRELSGRAFVDFPVNRTEIYPDYRKNPSELAKIIATIDSVRNDKDVTVKRITIKGYASPEGSYENNIRLAKGRTESLKQYVRNLYHFDNDFIATDYEPEDWAGLRAFVEQSGLEHRAEILAIIDSDMAPDPKNDKIRLTYPEEYKFLLQTVYPGLRHSDYTIEYTIRQYSDVNEIREVLATAPQKLSLEEMFMLARTLEPGSDLYNELIETAVRMYPSDETVNLNAANAAMQRRDLLSAERFLAKAGTSAEADYARGVLAVLKGDYKAAYELLETAARGGVEDSMGIRSRLRSIVE